MLIVRPVFEKMSWALAAVMAVMAQSSAAEAGCRLSYHDGMIIEAVSRFGNGRQFGPVRSARYGWEVRLPGGTWVACRRSCEETLRVETVDYYEGAADDIGRGTLLNECGVFGCLEIKYPR